LQAGDHLRVYADDQIVQVLPLHGGNMIVAAMLANLCRRPFSRF
jgi:hypothetical protein